MPIQPFRARAIAMAPPFLNSGTGERFMYVMGLASDAIAEKRLQATRAAMPLTHSPYTGELLTVAQADALAEIGSDVQIPRGITESDLSYATRLQRAIDAWRRGGIPRGPLTQLLGYLLTLTPRILTVSTQYQLNEVVLVWRLGHTLGLSITAASNASPIVITTATAHNFVGHPSVLVTGATGNEGANGGWTVTVVDAFNLQLVGSNGTGAYTGGGRIIADSDIPASFYPPARLSSSWDSYAVARSPSAEPTHTYVTASGGNWNWDSLSPISGSWGWWQAWFVFDASGAQDFVHPAPAWGTGVKWGSGAAWGLVESTGVGLSILIIVKQFKYAGTWVRGIVITFDGSLFDPAQPAGGGINPDGTFGRWSKVVNGVRVRSRYPNAVYGAGVL